jgi:tetratricopeptide (TPR) repeat protein
MGLFDNLFGNKSNQPSDQQSVDYIRVNLLAKLGEEKLGEEKYGEAINYILEFFELMSRNSFPDLQHLIQPCNFNLALAYSNLEDYSNAIVYWTKFIQSDKTNFDAYHERLKAFFELNKLPEAIQDIDSALRIKPNRADLYINKGIAFIKMGNKIEARKALTRAKELGNPDAQNFIDNHC